MVKNKIKPALDSADGVRVGESPVPGMRLRCICRGHKGTISQIAWSPCGRMIASSSLNSSIRIWDAETGNCIAVLKGHKGFVYCVAWSSDGALLASGGEDMMVRLWDVSKIHLFGIHDKNSVVSRHRSLSETSSKSDNAIIESSGTGPTEALQNKGSDICTVKCIAEFEGHEGSVYSVSWSQNEELLTSGDSDGSVILWNSYTGDILKSLKANSLVTMVVWSPNGKALAFGSIDGEIELVNANLKAKGAWKGHENLVGSLAWSPDGRTIASGSADKTIRLWDIEKIRQINILEGHTGRVTNLSFSYDNRLLASKSNDGSVRIWRSDSWETVLELHEQVDKERYDIAGLAFHPTSSILATLGEKDGVIRIWDLDIDVLLGMIPVDKSVRYTAAKIVMVGESGVGKTGLGWRLVHDEYKKHDSTHGQQFWLLDSLKTKLKDGTECEAVLWDLAGQPDYRLIHGLFLDDADLALLIFDPADPLDPLRGVDFWLKSIAIKPDLPCRTILVGGRCDVGDSTSECVKTIF